MQISTYIIRDIKAAAYQEPFFLYNDAVAIRACTDLVNSEQHTFNKNPEDYSLYKTGSFDDQTGKIDALKEPEHIVSFNTLIREQK